MTPFGIDWLSEAVLVMPAPLIVLANLGVRREWARITTLVACGLAAAGLVTVCGYIWLLTALTQFAPLLLKAAMASLVLAAAGVVIALLLIPRVRLAIARVLPIDPRNPVHVLALTLVLIVASFQLWIQLGTDALSAAADAGPVSRIDLVSQELPLLLAALLGVGLFTRRNPAEVAKRLGWVVPKWWHVALALAVAGVFFVVGNGFDYLGHLLTPDLAHKVDQTDKALLGGLSDPLGIATIALAAGICEEALFRGALQPRVGIVVASLVFALVHTQYGLSFDTLAVLVLGAGLGIVRRFLNTTSSTITHVAYNTLAGAGLGGALVPIAVAVEILLAATAVAGLIIDSRMRRNSFGDELSPAIGRQ